MITPDTKDWTWVLQRPCPECGVDASAIDPATIGARVRDALPRWQAVLDRPDARVRPAPDVWSPSEYAAHVRDVFRLFDQRLASMIATDGVAFANWDQDTAALEGRYAELDPADVADELVPAGAAIADRFDAVRGAQWDQVAYRSDGAQFTTKTFGRYFLHDIEHHLHDVAG